MLGYIKALAARARRVAEETGQNLVETALIIGVISIVIVGAFMSSNISAGLEDTAEKVACQARGGAWTKAGTAGAVGTCLPN